MDIHIEKRRLKIEEVDQLIADIKKVPQLIAGDRRRWQKFDLVYILCDKRDFVGICAIVLLDNWVKLGPLVILERFRDKGYAKQLIAQILKDYQNYNMFIGSMTPAVWKIANNNGFTEVKLWKLPKTVQKYLLFNSLEHCRKGVIGEWFRKLFVRKNKYRSFIRLPLNKSV